MIIGANACNLFSLQDYHTLRNYLHVVDQWGEDRAKQFLPEYAQKVVEHYLATDESMSSLDLKVKSKTKQ